MEDWLCLRVPSSDTARGKAEFEKGELGRRAPAAEPREMRRVRRHSWEGVQGESG